MSELLAPHVLSALRELIISQQGGSAQKHEPTANEYYACILSSLTSSQSVQLDHIAELMVIMKGVLPAVSKELVRASFRQCSPLLLGVVQAYNADTTTLRHCVAVLGTLLSLQESGDGFWASLPALQCMNAFIVLLDDDRTSVRKAVGVELTRLLAAHKTVGATGMRMYLADFGVQVLQTCTRSDYKRAMHLAQFLTTCMGSFPEAAAAALLSGLLGLRECRQPSLTAAAFKCVDATMQNAGLRLTAPQVTTFLAELLAAGTDTLDMESNVYFFSGVTSCVLRLVDAGQAVSEDDLIGKVNLLMAGFRQEFVQIHTIVGASLKRLLTYPKVPLTGRVLDRLLGVMQAQYQPAWFYAIDMLRSLLARCAGQPALAGSIVEKLAEVYQSCEDRVTVVPPNIEVALRDALSAGVNALRLGAFLQVVPLNNGSSASVGILEKREWILHLLHTALKLFPCTCAEFSSEVLGRVTAWEQAIAGRQGARMNTQERATLRRNIIQMWSLFPDFCTSTPTDLATHYNALAPQLMMPMKDVVGQAEVVPYIVTGITNLANAVKEEAPGLGQSVLGPSCSVFLPTLLTVIESRKTTQDGLVQSCVSATAAWAALAPSHLITSVGKKLFKIVLSSNATQENASVEEDAEVSNWMNVILAILPYLEEAMVVLLYKTLKPILTMSQSTVMQKRGYLILDALLKNYAETVLQVDETSAIVRMVADSLYSCHVSSRHMRLRCIHTLIEGIAPEEREPAVRLVFGEVLICLKDNNKKCRDAAADAIRGMVGRCPPIFILQLVCAGLVAETSVVRSSALMALSLLMLAKRNDSELLAHTPQMLDTCRIMIEDDCREQSRAVLGLMRVLVAVVPVDDFSGGDVALSSLLPLVLETVFWESPHKERFAARIRGITRKLVSRCGGDVVKEHLPGDNLALVDYILRRERKTARKRAGTSGGGGGGGDDAWRRVLDSDSEGDDDEDDGTRTKAERPRAIRASTVAAAESALPCNLDDLLEDTVGPAYSSGSTGSTRGLEEDGNNKEDDYEMDFGTDGRLVIKSKATEDDLSITAKDNDGPAGKSNTEFGFSGEEAAAGAAAVAAKAPKKPRERVSGEEYKAKKGSGDVWRKGVLAPHAFIPLDARMFKKKAFAKSVASFGKVLGKTKTAKASAGRGKKGTIVGNRNQRKAQSKQQYLKREEK